MSDMPTSTNTGDGDGDWVEEDEETRWRRHFANLVKAELHDLLVRIEKMEGRMADFDTALTDLAAAVKAVGDRVSADIATLKDEIAASGAATTARFQTAADSIEAQAAALASIDPAAPVPPPAPATPPAAASTVPGGGPTQEQSPTATPAPTPADTTGTGATPIP